MLRKEIHTKKKLIVPFTAALVLSVALPAAHGSEPKIEQNFGHQAVSGDFNGDGYDDLAVGNPSAKKRDSEGKSVAGGSVEIFLGSDAGLSNAPVQTWYQSGLVFPNGLVEKDDQFGYAVAAGDLNGDGYDDLAIGAPGEDILIRGKKRTDAGVVNVLYGSASGLLAAYAQTWHQSLKTLPGVAENDDRFGMALTIGDLDDDGYGDLAIGVPLEDVGKIKDMGVVVIVRGSSTGLIATNVTELHQNKYGVASIGRQGEMFGFSLVSADLNSDNIDDLAIGVPFDMVKTRKLDSGNKSKKKEPGVKQTQYEATGAVNVLYGSRGNGLRKDNDQWWHQNRMNVLGLAEKDDLFGWSLAAGDFNGDRVGDLAIGIPGESLKNEHNVKQSGAVEILFGQAGTALSAANNQFLHQASAIQSIIEDKDFFGTALASGDFDADGIDDLAVGVPGEDVGKIKDAGLVNVLYGAYGEGLTEVGQVWHQNKSGVQGSADKKEQFGGALSAGDFNGDGPQDLAISSPADEEASADGSVNVLYGVGSKGLSTALDQLLVAAP